MLEGRSFSVKDISLALRISEKDAYSHLAHIQLTVEKRKLKFILTPAECMKCGFIFKKRERLKKPGKCPLCHGESITLPMYSIEPKNSI